MDVTGITNLATSMSQQRLGVDVSMAVLKLALNAEQSSAAQLIAAMPSPETARLPANLGRNINTSA